MTSAVKKIFDEIAPQYEKGNAILSLMTYKLWNRALIKTLDCPNRYLDLCAGTGDIAFGYLKKRQTRCETTLLDFSPGMLGIAKEKGKTFSHPIEYIEGDAHQLPFPDASFDAVTIAYGIRNLQNPKQCFDEVARVLRPGGTFGILELTRPKNRFLRFGHRLYLKTVLPFIGKWLLGSRAAYSYLSESIDNFASPEKIEADLKAFDVQRHALLGGVATIWKCTRTLSNGRTSALNVSAS